MLELSHVAASYGASQILFDVDLQVRDNEVVTLLGRNGMGKTTTVNTIMGLLAPGSGSISFFGQPIHRWPPYKIARAGVALVMEGRQVFPNLSVEENLLATAANWGELASPWTLDGIYALFPALAPLQVHMGGLLSGGEQQMLAIGRALMTNPRLLILDEATEGLAPRIRAEIWRALEQIKQRQQAVLVIDKNIKALCRIAERHNILEKGRVVWTGDSSQLMDDADLRQRFLGV